MATFECQNVTLGYQITNFGYKIAKFGCQVELPNYHIWLAICQLWVPNRTIGWQIDTKIT